MEQSGSNVQADWYPDPFGRFEYRFHNGSGWTADVSAGGSRYVDPFGIGPTPPPVPGEASFATSGARRDRIATAAMVLGIVGLAISWMPFLFVPGAICALLGLTFGVIAFRRRRPENRAFAITGAVTGGAGLLMVGVGVWTTSIVFQAVDDFENPPPYTVDITRCAFGDGSFIVEGTIENLGDRASDYRIIVRIPGARAVTGRDATIEVDDLDPGETTTFSETFRATSGIADLGGEPTCPVQDVTGPLPFGMDIDSPD